MSHTDLGDLVLTPTYSEDGTVVNIVLASAGPQPISKFEIAASLRAFADYLEDQDEIRN